MNAPTDIRDAAIADEELIGGLRQALHSSVRAKRSIRRIVRRPSSYQSSYPLEELTVIFEDGEQLNLVFKNVSPRALSPAVRRAKPNFLDDPRREIIVYRDILSPMEIGTPRYFGNLIDKARDHYWLFLEKIAGQELYQIGELDLWLHAARWLARFHHRFSEPERLPRMTISSLTSFDEPYYEQWFDRVVRFAHESNADLSRLAAIARLMKSAPRIINELIELPTTLIHGEFYASNIIINDARQPVRVCPLDWERAAIGPGLIDLAALVAGAWPEDAKRQMAMAYRDELLRSSDAAQPFETLLRGLNLCRLHLAVQWLGWSSAWTPPKEHRQDWLSEALFTARELGFMT